jgi:flavin reductase (DIM6/NTAB) family NADH-FMN oxidoreductase RutF
MENGEANFRVIEPKILYFGTPVALISSLNEDGSTNVAPLTGKNPVPEIKANQFHFVADKFRASGLSPTPSEVVRPARVAQCPAQMEARVNRLHRMSGERLEKLGGGVAAEVEVVRVHVAEEFVLGDRYVDPEKWSPLIYNFRHYFRLAEHELGKTFRAER